MSCLLARWLTAGYYDWRAATGFDIGFHSHHCAPFKIDKARNRGESYYLTAFDDDVVAAATGLDRCFHLHVDLSPFLYCLMVSGKP